MKLLKIKLNNFRQFYEEQSITFSSDVESNVTVIFGENGKGKTGIFRALVFGLFGQKYLSQDNKKYKIHLVNFNKLEENPGMPVAASVLVEFENDGMKYEIERGVQAYKIDNSTEERVTNAKLSIYDVNGNASCSSIENEDEINEVISKIIDEKIKDFFFFDAEKIETLARTDSKTKAEVKAFIVKLLQIDKVDKAIELLKDLYRKENRSITEKSNNIDLLNNKKQIDEKEKSIKDNQEKIDIKEKDLELCKSQIEEDEKLLAENEGIKVIQEEHSRVKSKKGDMLRLLHSYKDSLRNEHFNQGHSIFMSEAYMSTKEYLNQVVVDKRDLVSIDIIESSLRDMTCKCCGVNLEAVKEAYENVLKMKENYKRSEITPLVLEINSNIHEYNSTKDQHISRMKDKLVQIRGIKDEIEEINKKLDGLKSKREEFSSSEEKLNEIENKLKEKKAFKESLSNEIQRLNIENEMYTKQLEKLTRETEDLMRQDNALNFDTKKLKYIKNLKDELEKVFVSYSDEMRKELMNETTNIFRLLIDDKDKNLIQGIEISDKYEIDAKSWQGRRILQDLSQGQKQVLALAFITALAKIASKGEKSIKFPLFMDTPFGRISGKNRDNLIENIPNLTSQWILLLTDTEFTVSEEMKMKSTKKLGKWYKLDQIKPGHTNIVEIPLSESIATRR